jgi:membrane-bound ClpP family serine protease
MIPTDYEEMRILPMNLLLLATQANTHLFSFFEAIETAQAIVLILGLVLMVIELFMPGFGVAGGAGILLVILGIVMTARNAFEATVMVILLLILAAIMIVLVLRSAKKGKLSKKMILWSSARKEDGYRSTDDRHDLTGREGIAITTLRPSGTADFDGERLDVVSEGAYIPAQAAVKIIRVEGRRIVVRLTEKASSTPDPNPSQD